MAETDKNMLSQKISIRKCRDSDYRFIYDISKRNMEFYIKKHWGGWNPKKFKEGFNKDNIKVIEYKGKRIAFYDTELKGKCLYLHNLQITFSLRRKGLGRFLTALIEKGAKKKGLNKVKLRVFKDNPAKNFYLKLGYKITGNKKGSLSMERKLA